jgi:hypothetical protein
MIECASGFQAVRDKRYAVKVNGIVFLNSCLLAGRKNKHHGGTAEGATHEAPQRSAVDVRKRVDPAR